MKKAVLITGASSGFGQACARKFHENNYPVILTARRYEKLKKLKEELSNDSLVYIAQLDVRNKKAVNDLIKGLPDPFRDIGILINNAGLALEAKPFYEANEEDFETMIETNIKGLLYLTKAVLPLMLDKNAGHIINVGSTAGSWPYPGSHVYGGTKAFIQNFSRGLRADLLGKNIRVSNIEPGMSKTEFSEVRFKGDKEKSEQVYKGTNPLVAEDIAQVIYFCATLPGHVNINTIELMPTCQVWGSMQVARHLNHET